ncbi:hypothetical protein [Streptococcus loxodontisalivarius]|uniref:SMODS and SLOG-associating 2TM effector domain-containing protein n=1 Tax=Streptococcus loxodontisalivarius TaxID=1349415 RepID=A0ABS2PUH3_9STRE|nr:hypothetical protein [Streptococcus loxodontisalivarius]MBM7643713.1 hypothetical protein [Streptococcus loxodontisalivarius]
MKKVQFRLGSFITRLLGYWLLYAIFWEVIFNGLSDLITELGSGVSLLLSLFTVSIQLYYKQSQYIQLLHQETNRLANDIDLTRQHLQKLKRDFQPDEKENQVALVSHIHQYEDQLTQTKFAYNEAVKDYNEGIHLFPYQQIAKPKEKEYFSDFYI